MCALEKMISSCGCDLNYTPCNDNETSIACARDIYYGVMESSDIEKKCSKCPLECEWTTYGITSSFSYYPNDGRVRSLAKETLFKDTIQMSHFLHQTITLKSLQ